MSKARLIALSGICSAAAVLCMLLASFTLWATLFLAVIASLAVVIPLLVEPKGLTYSLLIYTVAAVLGGFAAFSLGNIVYVAPIIAFCMPFTIVKVYGESVKVSAKMQPKETLDDPFIQGKFASVVEVKLDKKKRLHPVVKWVLYYVLLEVAIGLTLLAAYLFVPSLFEQMIANKYFYLLLAVAQLVVIPYDLLTRGCLIGTTKILRKIVK